MGSSSQSPKTPKKESKEPNDRLSEEAYKISLPINSPKEKTYPYIPISNKIEFPIESKYASLKPFEVAEFYTRNMGMVNTAPKDWTYYQQILIETNSALIEPMERGKELAYSKFNILRVMTPEEWPNSDLHAYRELRGPVRPRLYNYIDYINAWEGALYYENRQLKFSWWIRFQIPVTDKPLIFPNWFVKWFQNFGLWPIIMPLKTKEVYERFVSYNPSLRHHRMAFASTYQVPWILKWEFTITGQGGNNFGESFNVYPCLGRRVLSKWWDKYDFFENHTWLHKGIISFEGLAPKKEKGAIQPENLKAIVKILAEDFSREELMAQVSNLIQTEEKKKNDKGKRPIDVDSTSSDESDGTKSISMQDSQDPNEDIPDIDYD